MASYSPERGDIVWLQFDPQAGHEQAGRRPALVVSPNAYNRRYDLALLCPVTSRIKGFPFEVAIPEGLPVNGVVLADHVKSLDWHAREAKFICRLPEPAMIEVLQRLRVLVS